MDVEPLACTVFLFSTFVLAGILQTVWFKCRFSRRFKWPLDGGYSFRGRRVFGDNKTVSGFVIMVPATGFSFWLLSRLMFTDPTWELWDLSPVGYALLGGWAGFWFMVGELPNSFMKRQFGIQPGAPAPPGWKRTICFVLDQMDSVFAALIAIAVVVPLPFVVWLFVIGLGGVVHWFFNVVLMLIGLKARAA